MPCVSALAAEMIVGRVGSFAYVDVDGVNAIAACREVDSVEM